MGLTQVSQTSYDKSIFIIVILSVSSLSFISSEIHFATTAFAVHVSSSEIVFFF